MNNIELSLKLDGRLKIEGNRKVNNPNNIIRIPNSWPSGLSGTFSELAFLNMKLSPPTKY
jgi:hypothetical protein